MSISKSFKIKKYMNLTLPEYTVYSIISCNSDKNGISHITRDKICELSGIKKADTVTKHTNRLADLNLISKTYKYEDGKKTVTYKVSNPQNNFMWVSNSIFRHKPNLIAFCLKVAELRSNNTNWIGLTNSQIIEKIKITKISFYRLIKEAIKEGIITKTEDGYLLDSKYFPLAADKQKEAVLKQLNGVGNKVYQHYSKSGFKSLKMDVNKFLDWCIAGCPNKEEKIYKNVEFAF